MEYDGKKEVFAVSNFGFLLSLEFWHIVAFLFRPVVFNCKLLLLHAGNRKLPLMTVVTNFMIFSTKSGTTGRTVCCRIILCLLFIWERKHGLLFFLNFADNFTLVHDVIVKYGHGVWAAINYRICFILYNVCYAVARKIPNSVFVDEPSRSVSHRRLRGTGRIRNGRRDKMEDGIVFMGLKFKGAIVGIWIFRRLWRVTHAFWGRAI